MRRNRIRRIRLIVLLLTAALLVAVLPQPVLALDENVAVHITNILWNAKRSENGHAVAFEDSFTLVPGQSKGMTASGVLSYAGGRNNSAGGLGYTYKFLNVFVLATEDSGPVLQDSSDVSGLKTIIRIANVSGGAVRITFNDNSTQDMDSMDIYVSPVYQATPNWYLNYHYVDNISTGSGSWSNLDAIVSYEHTFREPDAADHYQFLYWENEETGKQYQDGDKAAYTQAEIPSGTTKDVYVYAWWQPSSTIVYHYAANADGEEKEAFEDIDIYSEGENCDHQGLEFLGWYDAEGNKFEEGDKAELPAPTDEKADRQILHVYARYKVTITPQDNGKVYGEQDPELTAEDSGVAEDDTLEYDVVRVAGEEPGEYEISIESAKATDYPDGTQKYEIETEMAVFTIAPAPKVPNTGENGKLSFLVLLTFTCLAAAVTTGIMLRKKWSSGESR